MIARLWRGRVPAARGREYEEYQREVGPPGYRAIPGNRGIFMLGRHRGEEVEIAMLTLWESWDAVRAFAGEPVDRARYYERDRDFLIDPPERVEHFDVVAADGTRAGGSIVRLWRATTEPGRKEEALRREAEIGMPFYRRSAGNRGLFLLSRDVGQRHEIAMLSLWDSLDSIRGLVGNPPDRANYDEYLRRGLDYLIDLPERVEHFELLVQENFEEVSPC